MMNVAERLKKYRKTAGYSVKETVRMLGERGIAISDKTLYSWESGHRQPDAETFLSLCLVYGAAPLDDIEKRPETKAPEASGSATAMQIRAEILAEALERCGYIPKGGDWTDDQRRFLTGLVDFLDIYWG
ncbi:MAG TPA: helix-turn-helix domain-containing protein [Firmicutes bacterium]|nr:helix-turn-helix domain-containing protein [Bacillota bacterium]